MERARMKILFHTRPEPLWFSAISHLDAVNHARIGRREIKMFLEKTDFKDRVIVPDDGETVEIA